MIRRKSLRRGAAERQAPHLRVVRVWGDAAAPYHLVLAVPFAVLAPGRVLLIRDVPLRTTILREDELPRDVAAELHEGRVPS